MEKVQVLIAEDDTETSETLKGFLDMTIDLHCCGVAYDGEQALEMIYAHLPDVLLLDLIMPHQDGLSVLAQLAKAPPVKMPAVIITSALGHERVTASALELGADYYMIKPYHLSDLHDRIRMLTVPMKSEIRIRGHDLEAEIARKVISIGVATNLLGYSYLVESLKIIMGEKSFYPVSKRVYNVIAIRYGTTPSCVESALRKMIKQLYVSEEPAAKQFFKGMGRPSNVHFLTRLAEEIKQGKGYVESIG